MISKNQNKFRFSPRKYVYFLTAMIVIGLLTVSLKCIGYTSISVFGILPLLIGCYAFSLYNIGFFCLKQKHMDFVWDHCLKQLEIPHFSRILSIAAKDGATVFYLAERCNPLSLLVGYDNYSNKPYYIKNIKHNTKNLPNEITIKPYFVSGSTKTMPFKNSTFDLAIFATNKLRKNLDDDTLSLFSQLRSILKPGGGIIIYEPITGFINGLKRTFLVFLSFLPPTYLLKQLKSMGFTSVNYHNHNALRYITAKNLIS